MLSGMQCVCSNGVCSQMYAGEKHQCVTRWLSISCLSRLARVSAMPQPQLERTRQHSQEATEEKDMPSPDSAIG